MLGVKNMFENPGGKIKRVAVIFFWLSVVGYLMLAFKFGWVEQWDLRRGVYKEFQPLYFFGILILGSGFSYISALFMLGFGESVENIKESVKGEAENSDC